MLKGSVIICNDLIGFYVGTEGMYTLLQCEDGKVRRVIINDVDKHCVSNPHALAHLFYRNIVEGINRSKKG